MQARLNKSILYTYGVAEWNSPFAVIFYLGYKVEDSQILRMQENSCQIPAISVTGTEISY
jgi:hypothetical protein